MAVDLTQVANVDAEPGELPATMAAWVIRQEREGEPIDAFQVEEIEVPEPGAFEVIVRVMAAGRELQQRLGGARQARSRSSATTPTRTTTSAARTPRASCGRSGPGVTRWKPGDEVVIHCNQASYEDPEVHGLDPLAAPSQQIWGYETTWGSLRPVHQGPGPAAAAQARAPGLGGGGLLRADLLHRLPHADGPRASCRPGHRVLIWGAAGGLGVFATQLCARRRRRVRRRRLLAPRRASSSSSSAPRASSTATSSPA